MFYVLYLQNIKHKIFTFLKQKKAETYHNNYVEYINLINLIELILI